MNSSKEEVILKKLLVIVGPTGTGKTALALELAKKLHGEILSADSRQVYVGMDVGTGKEMASGKDIIKKEKCKWLVNDIPIHLYDVVSPQEKFSLADYQQLALATIKDIYDRGKLPILVGGTGLYIQAVTEGLKIPKAPPDEELRKKLEKRSLELLLEDLAKVDPVTFEKIDKNNPRRVIRALEVYYQTGQPFSTLQEKFKTDFEVLKIGLTGEREALYEKVDARIDKWFVEGFEDEVKNLVEKYDETLPALTSLGYRQMAMYLDKKITLEEAKQRMKFEHHGYIRRQLTWFKRDRTIFWFTFQNPALLSQVTVEIENWLNPLVAP